MTMTITLLQTAAKFHQFHFISFPQFNSQFCTDTILFANPKTSVFVRPLYLWGRDVPTGHG